MSNLLWKCGRSSVFVVAWIVAGAALIGLGGGLGGGCSAGSAGRAFPPAERSAAERSAGDVEPDEALLGADVAGDAVGGVTHTGGSLAELGGGVAVGAMLFPEGPAEKRYSVRDSRRNRPEGEPAGHEVRLIGPTGSDGHAATEITRTSVGGEVLESSRVVIRRLADGAVVTDEIRSSEEAPGGGGGGDGGGVLMRTSEPMVLGPGTLAMGEVFEQRMSMTRLDPLSPDRSLGDGSAVRRTRLMTADELREFFGAEVGPRLREGDGFDGGVIGVVTEMDVRFPPARDVRTEWNLVDPARGRGVAVKVLERELRVFGITTTREALRYDAMDGSDKMSAD